MQTDNAQTRFSLGSLVSVRDREWIVQPGSNDELLLLKPLGGSEDEIIGVLSSLERISSATFDLPNPARFGDYRSAALLRDALRLSFRSGAGSFRSFGRLGFDPHPYQLLPLMMALKLNPVRLLIADDVGVGKTIESLLIARELLDRGEISRLAVLCPPHLAEQWQLELKDKFHITAELVLANTAKKLEAKCLPNESIFDIHPFTVISIDYIKSDRRKEEFLRSAPEFIIVDEAHTVSHDSLTSGSRHQRHELVKSLSEDDSRHLVFATATPHSGNENAFYSLLNMLDKSIENYPLDLSGKENEKYRRNIAKHYIQRRRADIVHYLEDTVFPQSISDEDSYELSAQYQKLFDSALAYARELVQDTATDKRRQRVRWWSALALLRSLASSPAAAKETMLNRSQTLASQDLEEADEIGRKTVMDESDSDLGDNPDLAPGSYHELEEDHRGDAQLKRMAKAAEKLYGDNDHKLLGIIEPLQKLIKDGFSPIIFCRFIPTVEYLTEELRKRLKDVTIAGVSGILPPEEREIRVQELARSNKRILVCTDCLSEGINLQDSFDAVIHYDLSWNPTRHEQREGRVDRFGQSRREVRMLTYYGKDNGIDGIVLEVLIRKHNSIRNTLGVSVPVPFSSVELLDAIFEGLLLRESSGSSEQMLIPQLEKYFAEEQKEKLQLWDKEAEREKQSRSLFAQHLLARETEPVQDELNSYRRSLGAPIDVQNFVHTALTAHGAKVVEKKDFFELNLSEVPEALRENAGFLPDSVKFRYAHPAQKDTMVLTRTHPTVEGLANYILSSALDESADKSIARRSGVIRTSAISRRHTLLLLRCRYLISEYKPNLRETQNNLIEDSALLAFTGMDDDITFLCEEDAHKLLELTPEDNIDPGIMQDHIQDVIDSYPALLPHLENYANQRAEEILESHTRVRKAAGITGRMPKIEAQLPPDLLGIYIYLPLIKDF